MTIELGTGVGVSTAYLAAGVQETPLYTIEGSLEKVKYAREIIRAAGLENVEFICGEIDQELDKVLAFLPDRFLVFMDANHAYEPSVRYLRSMLSLGKSEGVIIIDDIYWSQEMNRAWKEVITWPEVRVSIDLFHMGILLLRKDLNKAGIKVKY